jgi:hypothetical protein
MGDGHARNHLSGDYADGFTVIIRCVPNNPLTCSYLALGHVCPYRDAPPMSAIFQG